MALHESTFGYLMPTDEQKARMERLRAAAKAYADAIEADVPNGPDKTYVLRAHRQNAMWVNVAVTRNADGAPRLGSEDQPTRPMFGADRPIEASAQ